MIVEYYSIFYKEHDIYWLEFPDLPGCISQGAHLEEAKRMAKEAMELYLDGMDIGDIPPKSEAEDIDVKDGELVLIKGVVNS